MGLFDFTAMGTFVPSSKFSIDDVPDLTGKVAIVTGANSGLGKLNAQILLSKNARVYAACRSLTKGEEAIEEMKRITGKQDIHLLELDLADIKQCDKAAKDFVAREERLDMLINSAGVLCPPKGSKTADGYEMQFGVHALGHFAFTRPLIPLLRDTASSLSPGSVRVVWVSSSGHFLFTPNDGINFAAITDVSMLDSNSHYGQSKLATIHLANECAKLLRDDGIISVSLHPGNIKTDIQRHSWALLKIYPFHPVDLGVLTQLYAACSPEVTMADTGGYYVPWARKYHPSHAKANDPDAQRETWAYCETQVDLVLSGRK